VMLPSAEFGQGGGNRAVEGGVRGDHRVEAVERDLGVYGEGEGGEDLTAARPDGRGSRRVRRGRGRRRP
jgi:hypothetical protein